MEDWLYYFQNAEMVITDSFHGCCFSIIFEKPFVAIGNKRRGIERFYSLLTELGLFDRFVLSADEIKKNTALFAPVDYATVNKRVETLREQSLQWLRNALEKPHAQRTYSTYDLLDQKMAQSFKQLEDKLTKLNKQVEEQKKLITTNTLTPGTGNATGQKVSVREQELFWKNEQLTRENDRMLQELKGHKEKIAELERLLEQRAKEENKLTSWLRKLK